MPFLWGKDVDKLESPIIIQKHTHFRCRKVHPDSVKGVRSQLRPLVSNHGYPRLSIVWAKPFLEMLLKLGTCWLHAPLKLDTKTHQISTGRTQFQTSWKPWKICKSRWEDVLRILSYKVSSFFLKVGRGFIIRLNQPISKCTTIICSVGGSKIPFLSIKAGHTEMEFNTYRSWGSQFVEDVISWSCPPRQIQAVQIDGVQYQHKQFLLKWTPPLKKRVRNLRFII